MKKIMFALLYLGVGAVVTFISVFLCAILAKLLPFLNGIIGEVLLLGIAAIFAYMWWDEDAVEAEFFWSANKFTPAFSFSQVVSIAFIGAFLCFLPLNIGIESTATWIAICGAASGILWFGTICIIRWHIYKEEW